MQYAMRSVSELKLDLSQANPSKLLVQGTNGACIGICLYNETEFLTFGVHDDQEGFVIAEGEGSVFLDGEILPVQSDFSLILQPGVRHSFRRNPNSVPLKVFWFHAAP